MNAIYKYMKKVLPCLFLVSAFALHAQTHNMIGITPVVSNEMGFPPDVQSVLDNVTRKLVTANGMGETGERFVLVPNITVVDNITTSTVPPMYAMELDVSFYVLDPVEGVIFHETTFPTVKVAGKSESDALKQAIRKITPNSREARAFIDASKKRILDYYNAHLPAIIQQAYSLAAQRKYDEACARLSFIPDVVDHYESVGEAIVKIVKERYNVEADSLINTAKGKIALKDYSGAMDILSQVSPISDRFNAAEKLVEQIKGSIAAMERAAAERARAAMAKQESRYQDNKEMQLRVHTDKVALAKQSIEAARQIGVAQAENQKPTIIQLVNNWFVSKFGKR